MERGEARFLDFQAAGVDADLAILEAAPRIALDTESDPFHRYYEKICLLQISTEERDFFFDPLEHGMPDRLRALLTDPNKLMLLHGADYDVRALKQSFDLPLVRLIDTGLAAQFLGRTNTGLKALLEEELSIVIDKGEQRSDWGRRPLTDKQLRYARQDTMHLLPLADRLLGHLDALGRRHWLEEECAALLEKAPAEKVFDPDGWRKIKGSKSLQKRGRQALAALYRWREGEAQEADKPPFRILRSEAMVRLATQIDRQGMLSEKRLKATKTVPNWIDRARVLEAIAEGLEGPVPDARGPRKRGKPGIPHTPRSKAALDALRKGRVEWAAALGMDPGFLVSSAVLEAIAKRAPEDEGTLAAVPGMNRWRMEAIGAQILAAVDVKVGDEGC